VSLVATVRAVHAGQLVVPPELRRQVDRPDLTMREKQTLSLVVLGLSNGEIASKLFVTEHTVKSHLSAAFRKLGVSSRAEAARVIADPSEGLGVGILAITPEGRRR
jgi:two-component system, NarL family, response regulator DesR